MDPTIAEEMRETTVIDCMEQLYDKDLLHWICVPQATEYKFCKNINRGRSGRIGDSLKNRKKNPADFTAARSLIFNLYRNINGD